MENHAAETYQMKIHQMASAHLVGRKNGVHELSAALLAMRSTEATRSCKRAIRWTFSPKRKKPTQAKFPNTM